MPPNNQPLSVIWDLVRSLQANEKPSTKKANTVTTAVGSLITAILGGLTFWIDSASDAPGWVPLAVMIVGMVGTVFGVSKTKNGMTDSVADKLMLELHNRIDSNLNLAEFSSENSENEETEGVEIEEDPNPLAFATKTFDDLKNFAESFL